MSHILRSFVALSTLLLGIGWHGEAIAGQLTNPNPKIDRA
jgi:hypothetical protein